MITGEERQLFVTGRAQRIGGPLVGATALDVPDGQVGLGPLPPTEAGERAGPTAPPTTGASMPATMGPAANSPWPRRREVSLLGTLSASDLASAVEDLRSP